MPLKARPNLKLGDRSGRRRTSKSIPVAFAEIRSGGPSKDGIPAIDSPRFEQLDAGRTRGWARNIADNEPVISLAIGGDARAYPVRVAAHISLQLLR
jgi:hypothetical protein